KTSPISISANRLRVSNLFFTSALAPISVCASTSSMPFLTTFPAHNILYSTRNSIAVPPCILRRSRLRDDRTAQRKRGPYIHLSILTVGLSICNLSSLNSLRGSGLGGSSGFFQYHVQPRVLRYSSRCLRN